MADIAREMGVSEAALYRYVDGKEGLFLLVVRQALLQEEPSARSCRSRRQLSKPLSRRSPSTFAKNHYPCVYARPCTAAIVRIQRRNLNKLSESYSHWPGNA